MDNKYILSLCDHTLLTQNATHEQIKSLIDDAIKYGTASVCIPPCYVSFAKEYANGKMPICTVIGFPNGYNATAVKVFETECAVNDGADEIDMVINLGFVAEGRYDLVLNEIIAVRNACKGKVLKVIVETCLLSDDQKAELCRIVTKSGADFIKTSTGFSKGGATREDISLFAANIGDIKIKAAGGIASLEDARDFISLGASRLGTSRIVKIIKEQEKK